MINLNSYSPEAESHFNDIINAAIQAGKTVCYTHSMIDMKPTPMIGSWAILLQKGDGTQEYSGAMSKSRQPRPAIHGFIKCFEYAEDQANLLILTSIVLIPTMMENGQLEKWDKYGWMQYGGAPVKDSDLWMRLLALTKEFKPQVLYSPNWYETPQILRVKELSLSRRSGPVDSVDEF